MTPGQVDRPLTGEGAPAQAVCTSALGLNPDRTRNPRSTEPTVPTRIVTQVLLVEVRECRRKRAGLVMVYTNKPFGVYTEPAIFNDGSSVIP